jgi:hypothetical protein
MTPLPIDLLLKVTFNIGNMQDHLAEGMARSQLNPIT